MKINIKYCEKFFTSLVLLFMATTQIGCTETFPLESIPDALIYLEYDKGSVSTQSTVQKGNPSYDALYSFLRDNQTGWSSDINNYVPSSYFRSELITINCGDDFVVINYKPKNMNQWIQISKSVRGCKAAIFKAQANK